jgi:trans-aconitate methyltransferase
MVRYFSRPGKLEKSYNAVMEVPEAIALIQAADLKTSPGNWADLGCGSGMFSMALSHLLPPQSKIYAVDKSPQRISSNATNQVVIEFHLADFTKDLHPFTCLDGILMANALHYVKDKLLLLQNLQKLMAPDGSFIIVEYDSMQVNQWVPDPIDFIHLKELFSAAGYTQIKKLGERPSIYRSGNIYACQAKL